MTVRAIRAPAPARAGIRSGTERRFAVLDGLRLCAAVMVMLYHYTALPLARSGWGRPPGRTFPSLWHLTAYGALGVQLFFVISGFVILMSCWGRSLADFVGSRVSRLYPAYWVCVTLTAVLLGVIWPGGPSSVTFGQYLTNLTMVQQSFGVANVDGVYWTLFVELCFYVLMAAFVLVGITPRRVLVFAAGWPILAWLTRHTFTAHLLQPNSAPLFAAGMVLYLLSRRTGGPLAWLVLAGDVVLGARETSGAMLHTMVANTGHPLSRTLCYALVAGFVLAVGLATLTPLARVHWRWLTWAGLLTYPLYLISQTWGYWVIHLLHRALPRAATLAVTCAAMLALAGVLHLLAERPVRGPLRRALTGALSRAAEWRPARATA